MFNTPLDQYFSEEHPKPDIIKFSCTANWRGYLGTWKIEDGFLYLTALQEGSCARNPPSIPLSVVFKNQQPPIKATWYTGEIRIPKGELLRYVHMGFASIYEKETRIHIRQGKVIQEEEIDNSNHPDLKNKFLGLDELKKMTKHGGIDPDNQPEPEVLQMIEEAKKQLEGKINE